MKSIGMLCRRMLAYTKGVNSFFGGNMGVSTVWGCRSKKDIVEYLRGRGWSKDHELLKAAVRGNQHWFKARRKSDGYVFIGLDLLSPGDKHDPCWGYNSFDESSGPHYYNCPIAYLKGLPPPRNDAAKEWRQKVVELYNFDCTTAKSIASLKPGDKVTYGGKYYKLVKPLGASRGWVVDSVDGGFLRMSAKQLKVAVQFALESK